MLAVKDRLVVGFLLIPLLLIGSVITLTSESWVDPFPSEDNSRAGWRISHSLHFSYHYQLSYQELNVSRSLQLLENEYERIKSLVGRDPLDTHPVRDARIQYYLYFNWTDWETQARSRLTQDYGREEIKSAMNWRNLQIDSTEVGDISQIPFFFVSNITSMNFFLKHSTQYLIGNMSEHEIEELYEVLANWQSIHLVELDNVVSDSSFVQAVEQFGFERTKQVSGAFFSYLLNSGVISDENGTTARIRLYDFVSSYTDELTTEGFVGRFSDVFGVSIYELWNSWKEFLSGKQ